MLEKYRASIASSFIFVVLLILVAGQGALWVWFLFAQKGHAREVLLDKVETVADMVSSVSAEAIEAGEYPGLRKLLGSLKDDGDILSVKVTDREGAAVMLMSSGNKKKKSRLNPFFVPWVNTWQRPIISDDRTIGAVEITYSGNRANEFMLGLITVPPAAQVFVFLAIIYAIYFFFQRKVGSPIQVLKDQMERITSGDLTVSIPDMESNEIGTVSDGLRFLVDRLSSNVRRLNSTADHVSETLDSINMSFEKSIGIIRKQSTLTDEITVSLKDASESQKLITDSTDKVSTLSSENLASLLQMKASAEEIVLSMDSLFEAAEKSYSIMAEMSQTSKVMKGKAREVLSSVENTSASVEEILASVREVERNAKESSDLAENVRQEAAQRGVAVVAEAVKGMEKISEKVNYSVDIVRRLESRSKDVQKILSVIKEVTEQTNLLSLNASIIAEQAGEHGKGFSVVAEEMRAMSNRTAGYTKEIGSIVNTTLAEIREVVTSIENGMEMVTEGSEVVYRVGESMSSILDSAHRSAVMAKMIARATEDQVRALNHIETSVTGINSMAFGMSGAMEEQARGSGYMLERLGEVREIAEAAKKGTEEQAEGAKVISRNLEFASEKMVGINEAVLDQQKVSFGIVAAMEDIRRTGSRTIEDAEDMTKSLKRLHDEIDMLKKEMERFRT